MAKQTEQVKPKAEIVRIDFSFNIGYINPEDPSSSEQFFQDQVNINFRNEQSLNQIIEEKPYLADIIPILAAKFKKNQDSVNTAGTDLKSKIAQIFSA